MLPVADTNPVTYAPVGANTVTLLVPVTPTVILPFPLTVTLLLPFVIAAPADAMIPVSNAPLPTK